MVCLKGSCRWLVTGWGRLTRIMFLGSISKNIQVMLIVVLGEGIRMPIMEHPIRNLGL